MIPDTHGKPCHLWIYSLIPQTVYHFSKCWWFYRSVQLQKMRVAFSSCLSAPACPRDLFTRLWTGVFASHPQSPAFPPGFPHFLRRRCISAPECLHFLWAKSQQIIFLLIRGKHLCAICPIKWQSELIFLLGDLTDWWHSSAFCILRIRHRHGGLR